MADTQKDQRLIDIGLRLKEFRKKIGYNTQKDFALAINTTRETLANYEVGRVEPTGAFLHNLSSKFGADINFILTGKSEKDLPDFDTYLTQLGVDDLMKTIVKGYMALPPAKRKAVKEYIEELAEEITKNKTTPAPPIEKEPKEFDETKKPEGISDEDWHLLVMHHRAERATKNTESAWLTR